ncbi:hypothetical protein [Streptomyces sp. WZ-12]|uniref:hypothetical protein n=1 Tax=Streptomyces sp. WZ-12 TaxID=3030210 RepID=UPI0023810992|nr:hypothetical protein [Streptomyces sp. WZ-12]
MTNQPRGSHRTVLTQTAFIAGPLCMAAYGAIRLSDPTHGPNLAWISGHIAMVAGVLLFGAVFLGLTRLSEPATRAPRLSARVAAFLGLAGMVSVAAQGVIDIVVGLRADDRAGMERLFEGIQSHPGVMPAVYTVGPALFYVGLVWLTIQLAVQRRIRVWRPALVVLGTATMLASLDLMPLGALLFCAALSSLGRDIAASRTARLRPA